MLYPTISRCGASGCQLPKAFISTPNMRPTGSCRYCSAAGGRRPWRSGLGDRAGEFRGRVFGPRRPSPSRPPRGGRNRGRDLHARRRHPHHPLCIPAGAVTAAKAPDSCYEIQRAASRHGNVEQIAAEVAPEFPDVAWDKMLVDAMTVSMTLKTSEPRYDRRHQSSRRHIVGPRRRARGQSRRCTDCQHRSPTALSLDVRADSRLGVRHRRQGYRQPGRHLLDRSRCSNIWARVAAAVRLMSAVETVTSEGIMTPDVEGTATTQEVTNTYTKIHIKHVTGFQ